MYRDWMRRSKYCSAFLAAAPSDYNFVLLTFYVTAILFRVSATLAIDSIPFKSNRRRLSTLGGQERMQRMQRMSELAPLDHSS